MHTDGNLYIAQSTNAIAPSGFVNRRNRHGVEKGLGVQRLANIGGTPYWQGTRIIPEAALSRNEVGVSSTARTLGAAGRA